MWISNPIITSDTIRIAKNRRLITTIDTAYGIYLDHCTGYKVEENTIKDWDPEQNDFNKKVGIIINNSGGNYNEIYKNFIDDLPVGILAQNNNRALAPNYETGLKIFCNECMDNLYDLVVNSNITTLPVGISKYQGYYISQWDNYPAGNLFSNIDYGISGDYNYNNEAMFINYYHHDPFFEPRVVPEDYSENSILLYNTNESWNSSECPSKLDLIEMNGTDHLYNEMTASSVSADSVNSLLSGLTDGGNTTGMVNDVSTSFPDEAWEVYTDLMNESPYLSDTVMEEAILKENVLAEAMVRDVLVANQQAAKSDEVMNTLDSRINPLPDYMIQEIEQGKTITSAKEGLEAEASFYEHSQIMTRNELMRYYINDSINPGPNDSLLYLLQINNSDYTNYLLAISYLEKGDIINMNATLNAMNTTTQEHQDYITFLGIMANLKANGLTVYDIDSTQQQQLLNLATGGLDRVNIYARNILKWHGHLDYSEILLIPDGSPKSEPIKNSKQTEDTEFKNFNIYPNPAKNYAILEWDVAGNNNLLEVRIVSALGESIRVSQLTQSKGQKVINLSDFPSGVYMIILSNSNNIEASKKLIVQ